MLDQVQAQLLMADPSSSPTLPAPESAHERLNAFFAAGGLTVYASTTASWRWLVCAGDASLQATVIDPQSLFEKAHGEKPPVSAAPEHKKTGKSFERSRLVKWLTRAMHKRADGAPAATPDTLLADDVAFANLLHMPPSDWASMQRMPPLTEAEIMHFEQAHNVALSDIESAFLPGKLELPPVLASFYIRYLTRARRDAEATLVIAQSSSTTRVPAIMAEALAVSAFEGAARDPIRSDGDDYASSAAHDTSAVIDAAVTLALQKLALPIDHPDHLLRLNVMAIARLASEIVEQNGLAPFAFLLKAKELYLSRCDVCRFPPLERFSTALAEGDLNGHDPWVQRIAHAYARLFREDVMHNPALPAAPPGKIITFSQR